MKSNVGTVDMIIRLALSAVMFYIGFFDNAVVSAGLSKTIIGYAAFVPLLTGVFRFCPLYRLVGMNTCGLKK